MEAKKEEGAKHLDQDGEPAWPEAEAAIVGVTNDIDDERIPQFKYIKAVVAGPGVQLARYDIYEGCDCGDSSGCCSNNQNNRTENCSCLAHMGYQSCYVPHEPRILSHFLDSEPSERKSKRKPMKNEMNLKRRKIESTPDQKDEAKADSHKPQLPLFECNKKCKCPASCPTRVVQRGITVKLEARKYQGKGWGVIAKERIGRLSFVCEYVGEILSTEEAKRRWTSLYDAKKLNYLIVVKEYIPAKGGILRTNIDATEYGNISRLFNHSCDPNLQLLLVRVDSLIPRLAFFAIRDIEPGEELTFHYGSTTSTDTTTTTTQSDETNNNRVPCHCGATNCTGWLPLDLSV